MKIKKINICGTGGTLRSQIHNEIIFFAGFNSGLDKIEKDKEINELSYDELKKILMKEIIKYTRGSLNPSFVNNKLEEILNKEVK